MLHVDVLDAYAPEDEGGEDVHLIDRFAIEIPETVSSWFDESNSFTAQGQHGIGILTLAYFNLTICSSLAASTFSASSPIPSCKIHDYILYTCRPSNNYFKHINGHVYHIYVWY